MDVNDLNNGQQAAFDAVVQFMASNLLMFLVEGAAGTGKTTIMEVVAQHFSSLGRSIILSAPTNRAVKVIADKTDHAYKAGTLHSLLYKVDLNGVVSRVHELPENLLLIVDESSMIQKRLLEDLVAVAENSIDPKILFVGDSGQLPPVNEQVSPVFKMVGDNKIALTQVMRQDENSRILEYANGIRRSQTAFIPSISAEDVWLVPVKEIGQRFLYDLRHGEDSILVVWTNRVRLAINAWARKNLGYSNGENQGEILSKAPKAGEKMISIANGSNYVNGDMFDMPDGVEIVSSHIINVLDFNKVPHKEYVIVARDVNGGKYLVFPSTEKSTIYHQGISDVSQWLPRDFWEEIQKRYSRHGRTYTYQVLRRDVTLCTFAYAVTAHKAQGGQWQNVYIHETSATSSAIDRARWLYTAITRASSQVFICNAIPSKNRYIVARSWDQMATMTPAASVQVKEQFKNLPNLNNIGSVKF